MAKGLIGPDQDQGASPYNLGGQRRQAQANTNPYQSGLQANFTGDTAGMQRGRQTNMDNASKMTWKGENNRSYQDPYATSTSADFDIREAQRLTNELSSPDAGVDQAADAAQLNMYRGRIGLKNSLGEAIGNSDSQENLAEQNVRQQADQTLGQGLDNTRDNYNSRGLLFSGMREGAEQSVRNNVAGQMAAGIAGTRQDYGNSKSAAQNAYASADLANQQDTLNRANQAFDTANQNNIARMQAMQQLGSGLGQVAGQAYGSNSWGKQTPSPSGPSNYDSLISGYQDSGNSYGHGAGLLRA